MDATEAVDQWLAHGASSRGGAAGASSPGWTHSEVPSAQFSHFQIGTTSLMRSISQAAAAKARAAAYPELRE